MKDFEILKVGIFSVDVEFDPCHWDVHYQGSAKFEAMGAGSVNERNMLSYIWHSGALESFFIQPLYMSSLQILAPGLHDTAEILWTVLTQFHTAQLWLC